ncbi:response regulator [Parasphingopyxis sp. CP4]|uniref:hybrid sensor histidine kinase/response regulator n=1 Tax=Parasphingopyxis sp. CP4 TaxID=2724527 RepID=UPI0015A2CD93|nr:ATP-binding protein [Parasphingopyxis sp. CP4]QLC22219.1 response regulator [Parasphingopyxis sp. CP4]
MSSKDDPQIAALLGEAVDSALFALDSEGRISSWNSGAEQLFGQSADTALWQHFSICFTKEERANGLADAILEQARVAGSYQEKALKISRGDKEWRAKFYLQAVHDEHGEVTGFGGIARDITAEFAAEQRLIAQQQAVHQQERLRALGVLTGGIAHDFNNLLTVVRGSAELLQSDTLSPEQKAKQVDAIVETADRAAELTGQLLSFARQQPLQPERIDLNTVVAAIAERLKSELGGGIKILKAPESALHDVRVDPAQLENLVLNAATNARDAMDGEGTMTLATRNVEGANGEEVCLSIADTGTGMTPDTLQRAFDPFFTTKDPGKGTGLGLSQAYGFAVQSGGRLDISSEPGRGTTLSLYLPKADVAVPGDSADIDPARHDLPNGTRILLVEDSRTVAIFAQSLLEDMGCHVVHAANADEAILALEEESEEFDIIFSDIVMPGRSGLDLAEEVRSQKPELPILLATGYSEAAARGEGGEFPILPKPYKRDMLSEKLSETINAFRAAA